MEKKTLVHAEGIIMGEVEVRNVSKYFAVVVPIKLKEQGLVQSIFFEDVARQILEEAKGNGHYGKGLNFFFSGELRELPLEKPNGERTTAKHFTVRSFA